MEGAALLTGSMTVTALGGAGLSSFLLLRAHSAPGARPLAAFVALVGLWSVGLIVPGPVGHGLMSTAPLGAAVFLHFSVRLAGRCSCLLAWSYGIAAAAVAAALANDSGKFIPWSGTVLYRYEGAGLLAVGATLLLALLGHGVLADAWRSATGLRRRQIFLVMMASGLGLASVMGLAFPILDIRAYPWPLLLLPLYLAVLVYGVLRYELMAVNQWARRALTWSLLFVLAATLASLPAGLVSAEAHWAVSTVVVAVTLILWSPVRRLVDRLVFPGGEICAEELSRWREKLAEANDEAAVTAVTDGLLRDRFRMGESDWKDAPPGMRQVVEVMQGLRQEAFWELERRRAFAANQRLAELGALAATVAHDLRNPMNILAMAVADAAPEVRQEVKVQLARMEALVRDLLDYAKPWQLTRSDVGLAAAISKVARGGAVELDIPPGLTVSADSLRLSQALGNLLANAQAAGSRVLMAAERCDGAVLIHVCDDGPGIPEDIRDSLFQPFVSRGPGGTGLGLAIVAKVMAAHGGSVALGRRPGWTTCFTLAFKD